MKNLKIGKKFALVFGVVIIMFCIAVIISILGLQNSGNSYQKFYTDSHEAIYRATDTRTNLQTALKNITMATVESDPDKTVAYVNDADACMNNIRDNVAWFKENYKGDLTLINQFESQMDTTKELRNQISQLAAKNTAGTNREAQTLLLQEYNPMIETCNSILTSFSDNVKASGNEEYTASYNLQRVVLVIALLISLGALAVAVLMAFALTRAVVSPIKEIQNAMGEIQKGHLDARISYQSHDELGHLADNMRKMTQFLEAVIEDIDYLLNEMGKGNFDIHTQIEDQYVGDYQSLLLAMRKIRTNLSQTLFQISQSSDQVASGSDQVSSGAQALSQGATEQASSVEELAATVNEISANVSSNAENAGNASQKARHVEQQVSVSNERMKEMLSAMSDISSSSSEIGKIIKTIEDIAFQTNILALNAAVEAARAGEAGKGFAVVADEVRNLAGKSSEASKSTSALIEGSLRAVEHGKTIANETAEALERVVGGVQDVTSTIEQISNASAQQASSISQVTMGIDQISSVVQTNSATAEESAAASQELSGQAQMLKSLVGQFKLSADLESPGLPQQSTYDMSADQESASQAAPKSSGYYTDDNGKY